MSELNEMGCREFSDVAAELALGVLTGRERARRSRTWTTVTRAARKSAS